MNNKLVFGIKYIAFLALVAVNSFAADSSSPNVREDLGDGHYYYPAAKDVEPKKFIGVVVHGFNVKPELMEEGIKYFTKEGIPAVLTTLSGHRPDTKMDAKAWALDVSNGIRKATEKAPESKIILFGHSAGGSVATVVAANNPYVDILILLAPANGLRPLSEILNINGMKPCKNSEFVATAGPIIAVAKMFLGRDLLKNSGHFICGSNAYAKDLDINCFMALAQASDYSATDTVINVLKAKTLVMVDENDMLVDYSKIVGIFGDNKNCKIEIFYNAPARSIQAHTFQGIGMDGDDLLKAPMKRALSFILEE